MYTVKTCTKILVTKNFSNINFYNDIITAELLLKKILNNCIPVLNKNMMLG